MKLTAKFLAPILILLCVEILFRYGLWESMARPESHAGTSIRVKRALADPAFAQLDFVTLGSSRPVYGLDHERIAQVARSHGYLHANLSMPGSHWMTIDTVTGWLSRHRPMLRSGIIAVETSSFVFAGNGEYELGIAIPFRNLADTRQMSHHVPFSWNKPSTWALYSTLFQYREDIQDYVRHPGEREPSLKWYRERPAMDELLHNSDESRDMCDFGVKDLSACDRVDLAHGAIADGLRPQCAQLRSAATQRADFLALAREDPLPPFMRETRDLIRDRLRALHWSPKPLVVLMPVTGAWKNTANPIGLHEWTLSILQPLVADGTIRLIDATDALDKDDGSDCQDYFDFYHQNVHGRERLMQQLMPQIERALYISDAVTDAGAGS